MRKTTLLVKAFGFALLLLSAGFSAVAQAEFRLMTEMATRFSDVNDAGNAVMNTSYYSFANDQMTPTESDVVYMVSINNNEDVAGMIYYNEPESLIQAGFRKDNIWNLIDHLPTQNPESDEFTAYKISSNSKYVVGQGNVGFDYAGFIIDTETNELIGAFDPEGEAGAFYSVNNNGIAVGWIDRPDQTGTRRVPAYRTLDGEFHFLPEGQLPLYNINTIGDINNSDVMVGDFDLQPFIYDKTTDTFTRFENPGDAESAAFTSISDNGVAIGFADVDWQIRDAIIYHPSIGDQPVFLKDYLLDNGIEIETSDGLMGTAISVSDNGNYIVGWVNGPPMFAEGWIVYLDDLILGTHNMTQNQISLYPNPVQDILHINATDNVDNVKIFNLIGQEVTGVNMIDNNKQVDVSNLASGVYMLQVTSNATQETFKIVKQ